MVQSEIPSELPKPLVEEVKNEEKDVKTTSPTLPGQANGAYDTEMQSGRNSSTSSGGNGGI